MPSVRKVRGRPQETCPTTKISNGVAQCTAPDQNKAKLVGDRMFPEPQGNYTEEEDESQEDACM